MSSVEHNAKSPSRKNSFTNTGYKPYKCPTCQKFVTITIFRYPDDLPKTCPKFY